MTNDLREIIKETVLPQDFDTKIEVRIDGKEYEACCNALRPRGNRCVYYVKYKLEKN